MKKKNIILAGLCVLGLCAWQAQATNLNHASIVNVEDNVPTGYEIINLHGTLMLGIGPNAIDAGASRNSVYLRFNQSLGNVDVLIYDGAGNLRYSGVINTNVQQTIIIPVPGNNNGGFTVVLNNATGFAEGEFTQH